MKIRKMFSFISALALTLTLTAPVLADGEELPSEQETAEAISQLEPPEEDPEPGPMPEPSPDPEPDPVPEPSPDPEPDPVPELSPDPEPAVPGEEITDDGEIAPPEDTQPIDDSIIEAVVPAAGVVHINPYHLSVSTETGKMRDQIIHQAQPITNYSDFLIGINVTVSGKIAPDSTAQFVTAVPSPDSREKEVFMYVEFQASKDSWSGGYTDAPNQAIVTSEGIAKEGVLTLDAQSEGYFRLFGAMTADAAPMWSSGDAITVTLAYTFEAKEALSDPDTALAETVSPSDEVEIPYVSEEDLLPELDAPIIEPEYIVPEYVGPSAIDSETGETEIAEETEILPEFPEETEAVQEPEDIPDILDTLEVWIVPEISDTLYEEDMMP